MLDRLRNLNRDAKNQASIDFFATKDQEIKMEIKAFKEDQLPDLVKFQNSVAPARRHMSASVLRDALTDSARERGRNACLAYENGELSGFLAWVQGNDGEFFGSPFVVSKKQAAQSLLNVLLKMAEGKRWVRVSAFPEEQQKAKALEDNGFRPIFEFVEFETKPQLSPDVVIPTEFRDLELTTISPSEFVHLNNEAFKGVDNSLPIDEEEAKEILSCSLLDPDLSRIWRSPSGEALAFSVGNVDGYLDAIGVIPSAQGKGIGTLLYSWVISRAAKNGLSRVFTTVSSRNEGSLRMHRRLGIAEVERRTVWEKSLRLI